MGPNEGAEKAYVIHIKNPRTLKYDEDKVMLGFDSAGEAVGAFFDNYGSRDFFDGLETVFIEDLTEKLRSRGGEMIEAHDSQINDEFNEADHPRGQSGTSKGGQFVKGSGGRVKSAEKVKTAVAPGNEPAQKERPKLPNRQRENFPEKLDPEPVKGEMSLAQMKNRVANSEAQEKIIDAFKNGRNMGSIASIGGLPRNKAARAQLRNFLRKKGLYKEAGGWEAPAKIEIVLPRVQSGIGHPLPHIAIGGRQRQLAQQLQGAGRPDPRRALQQLEAPLQLRSRCDNLAPFPLQAGDGIFQTPNTPPQIPHDRRQRGPRRRGRRSCRSM